MSYQPGIDTELLRTFVAIAEHGGFTRAAEAVNRTQSAVSMQMKRLEEDVLQRSLFERDGRQTRLTAEGQVLLGYARRILKLHGEVFNTLAEARVLIEAWRQHYNAVRPHSALGYRPPAPEVTGLQPTTPPPQQPSLHAPVGPH